MFLLTVIVTTLAGQAYTIVAGFNRLNALGWKRKVVKLFEKAHIAIGLLLPPLFAGFEWYSIHQTNFPAEGITFFDLHVATQCYMIAMSFVAIVFTPMWLSIRPQFVIARDRFHIASEQIWKPDSLPSSPYADNATKLLGKLPRNEIGWTETNHKSIFIDHLPDQFSGFKIAHLSDIHLTGQLAYPFYHRAFDWVMEQTPDMIVVAGDIVDYDNNLADIEPVFQHLAAPKGCFFVLGNHDKRISNPMRICDILTGMGWNDAGESSKTIQHQTSTVEVIGNERPWFDRYSTEPTPPHPNVWRLGIAHSPDQFSWGIEKRCSLLLCGHTHGGQIRFPILGPLVSPSLHGSKYASGVFYQDGTVMHVSRGMAGVHPLRWGCPPEVSILHLAKRESSLKH